MFQAKRVTGLTLIEKKKMRIILWTSDVSPLYLFLSFDFCGKKRNVADDKKKIEKKRKIQLNRVLNQKKIRQILI